MSNLERLTSLGNKESRQGSNQVEEELSYKFLGKSPEMRMSRSAKVRVSPSNTFTQLLQDNKKID